MYLLQGINRYAKSGFIWSVLGIILIKVVLMGFFSSDYQNELFIPFVSDFLVNGGNPYQRFYDNGVTNAFPYPSVMLFIESIGMLFVSSLDITNTFAINVLFKIPSLILDIVGLIFLIKLYPNKRRYIVALYFASPIIFYGVYMHSQLDLIPIAFLIIALYFLISKKNIGVRYSCGVVFTSLSLLCKLHVIAVVPLIFFYLVKRDGKRFGFVYLFLVLVCVALGLVYYTSDGMFYTVLFNNEQNVLTKVFLDFFYIKLYLPILFVSFVYIISYKMNFMNRELFLNLIGIVFALFLSFCPPMPGWYVWIVPFFALYFASINEEKYKNIAIYQLLNIVYVIYFAFLHNKGMVDLQFLEQKLTWLKINSDVGANLVFTLMTGLLVYLLVSMFKLGIASNNFYKRKSIPFTIGISGDSGAGKSTMIGIVEEALGKSKLLFIEGDGDHKWERGDKHWKEFTALDPRANYLHRQAIDLQELREGSAVRRVDYDHSSGRFTSYKRITSNKYVLLAGLHALYLPQTRKNLDLKIYLDCDETLRRFWKIQRDTSKRGHSKDDVIKSIEQRMPDAEKFIYPQKEYADFVVKYFDKNLKNCMVDNYDVKISLQLTVSIAIDTEKLIHELIKLGLNAVYAYSDNLEKQIITFDANDIDKCILPLEYIASKVIPQIDEITQQVFDEKISTRDGIVILFLLLLISNKMQGIP